MDETDRFISDENIAHFVERLGRERDSVRRGTLQRLLIEEENRFGMTVERLRMVERHLAVGVELIARQVETIARLDGDGHDTTEARLTLQNFEMIHALFVECRARIYEKIDPF